MSSALAPGAVGNTRPGSDLALLGWLVTEPPTGEALARCQAGLHFVHHEVNPLGSTITTRDSLGCFGERWSVAVAARVSEPAFVSGSKV